MKEFLKSNFQSIQQVAKYGIAGITGAAIQVIFLYFFVDILEIWYLYGVALGFLISLIVAFLLQNF